MRLLVAFGSLDGAEGAERGDETLGLDLGELEAVDHDEAAFLGELAESAT